MHAMRDKDTMNGIRLIATGRAVPGRVVTNDDLREYVDTSDEWISSRTGIHQRYFCAEGESVTTLAVEAATKALSHGGIAPEEIGCVV